MADLAPYDRYMGFRAVTWSADGVVLEADVVPAMANPTGVLHGGVVSGLADSAMGLTAALRMPPGIACTNMDLDMRFLNPVRVGVLRAEARVVKEGKRLLFMAADVHEEGVHVAAATATFVRVPEGNSQTA